MKTLVKKAALATALAATALTSITPAMAQDYYGGRHHRSGGDDTAIAIGIGIIGLAAMAAIASSKNKKRYRHYEGRDYRYRNSYDGYGNDGYDSNRDGNYYRDRYDNDDSYYDQRGYRDGYRYRRGN